MAPTLELRLTPPALATQVLWMAAMVMASPSTLVWSTVAETVVWPVPVSTWQLAVSPVTEISPELNAAKVCDWSGGQVASGVFGIVTSPVALTAKASPGG